MPRSASLKLAAGRRRYPSPPRGALMEEISLSQRRRGCHGRPGGLFYVKISIWDARSPRSPIPFVERKSCTAAGTPTPCPLSWSTDDLISKRSRRIRGSSSPPTRLSAASGFLPKKTKQAATDATLDGTPEKPSLRERALPERCWCACGSPDLAADPGSEAAWKSGSIPVQMWQLR